MNEIEKLEQGITALEASRSTLGDAVVDAMLAPIREKLIALKARQSRQQRKQVSVLFADLAGFTTLTEHLDAEDVHSEINSLWARLDAIITMHGGRVDKHIGDEIMALWGAESAREDDPEQAIRAALCMQTDLADFRREHPLKLAMRVGIHTGPVMLGAVGSTGEYTALGDTVNLASRLQEAAPPGGILITHNTYRQVRGVFDMLKQDPLTVKGKQEPVQTYLVVQAKPRAFRLQTRGVEGVETRMIGRESEFARIQEALETVKSAQRICTVTISGEAGVGKSRLLYEYQNWLDLLPEKIQIFKGRATETMRSLPYALLRDVFAYRFEVADSDPLVHAREKLEAGITAYMCEDQEAVMKAHFIGHLIGLDFSSSPHLRGVLDDPKQIRSRAFHYLTQFFASVAQKEGTRAIVLFLDDLHWADDGSLDAFANLQNTANHLPILIIGLTRPVLFERSTSWHEDLRLDLLPLSEAESRQLVDEILQKAACVPPKLQELVVSGAEGNPFYLEELVKMLIDQKVILPGETSWEILEERLADIHIPSSLTGVLQARLDNLPDRERETMQRASVIGRVFWDSAVGALNDPEPVIPHTALQSLCKRELVFARETSAFAGSEEYIFKHAILREVTYETVLKRLRRLYHARAASWLVERSGERAGEYAGLIAGHFEQAGEADRASGWYIRAGEAALGRSAFNTASDYFSRARSLTSRDDPDYPALARQQAEASIRQGDFAAARQSIEESRQTARSITDQAAALATLAELDSESGDYSAAEALLAEALPLARQSTDRVTLTRALFALGSNRWRQGRSDDARTAFEECLSLARTLGDVTRELIALNRLGAVALTSGDLGEAERLWKEVYERALSVGNRERAMASVNNLGSVASSRQDYAAARDYILDALRLGREIGAQHTIALTLINLGELEVHLGNYAEARSRLREGLALAVHLGAMPRVLGAVIFFAMLAYADGQVERALALWGLARSHPAWHADLQRTMDQTLAEWGIAPALVESGLAQGAQLDWQATLEELSQAET